MSSLPIPYFQTTRIRVQAMVKLANIQPGERAADLGIGDGRIAIALAQAGAIVTGFENNTERVALAVKNSQLAGMEQKITIHQSDFWQEDLSPFSVIVVYPMPDVMDALEEKLRRELHPGARVLVNSYTFAHWPFERQQEHISLYIC